MFSPLLPRFRPNISRQSPLPGGRPFAILSLGVLLAGIGALLNGCGGGSAGGSTGPGQPTNPVAATPTFTPIAGTYGTAQAVTISDTTSGVAIYYTTDGSTPTVNSSKYAGPVTVSSSETIDAIAVASGYANSTVVSAAYIINLPAAATPTFSTDNNGNIVISSTTPAAQIYYTATSGKTGTTPTTNSTLYSGPIVPPSAGQTVTFEAIATATNFATSAVGTDTVTTPPAQTNLAQNIFSNIAAVYNGPPTSGGRVNVYDTINGFLGSNEAAGLGSNLVADVSNPASSDHRFGNTGLFIGGSYISVNPTSVTKPLFVVDTAATGQSSPVVLTSYVETISINPSAGTAVPTFAANSAFVALPFTNSGGTPTPYGVNTGADLAVCVSNNAEYGFIPVSNGSNLGAFTPANPPVAPTQDCSGMWIDSNNNVGVISGTGTSSVVNMYDKNGNWLLSAAGGAVSLNSTNGTVLNAISSSTNVQGSISVSPTLSQSVNLYYLQGGNLESVLIEPGTDGAKPTVIPNSVFNPNGGSFGSSVTLIAGTQTSPGIPTSLGLLTGSTLFSLSVTSDASGLNFTETGNSVLPFTSGIMLGQTSTTYLAASTSTSQPGVYAVQKLSGGSLGSATPSNTNISGPTGIVVDNNGNPSTLGVAGDGNFLLNGNYMSGGAFEAVPPNGGAIFTVSPTIGTGVNFTNSTSNTVSL